MSATYRELDTVVLRTDIPASGLRAGDLGAIVHVYPPDAVEGGVRDRLRENPGLARASAWMTCVRCATTIYSLSGLPPRGVRHNPRLPNAIAAYFSR